MNLVRFALPIFTAVISAQLQAQAQVLAPEPGPLKIRQIIPGKKLVVATQGTVAKIDMEKIYLATFSDGTQCELKTVGQNQTYITLDGSECEKFGSLVLNLDLEPSLHVIDEPLEIDSPTEKATAPIAVKNKSASKAFENTPKRSIADQSYMIPGRRFGLDASWGRTTEEFGYYNATTLLTEVKTYRTTLGLAAGYGLTDNLNLILSMNVIPGETTELKAVNQSLYSKGFEDPKISIAYRVVAQSEVSPMDVIVNINYSPKIFTARTATDDAEGTSASGRSVLGFDLKTIRRFDNLELGFQLGYRSYWSGARSNAETGAITEMGAIESYIGGIMTQFPLSKSFFLNGTLAFSSFSSGEDKNTTQNTLTRSGSYSMTGFQLGARFVLIPDTALLDFSASRMTASNFDVVEGTTKVTLKDIRREALEASIKYLF